MGGRGRGRGQTATFSRDQLGLQKSDLLGMQTVQPPTLYPPMEYKPLPLSSGPVQERLVAAKKGLRSMFRESPFYVKADLRSSWVTEVLNNGRDGSSKGRGGKDDAENSAMFPDYCWKFFPRELVPVGKGGSVPAKKRKQAESGKQEASGKKKPRAGENILEKLSKLEEKDGEASKEDADAAEGEGAGPGEGGGSDSEGDEKEQKGAQALNEDEEPVEDEDEEMDEGTDYANNYFDAGDDFGEDDGDDGDDGPVF